jgi:hypothetical protein
MMFKISIIKAGFSYCFPDGERFVIEVSDNSDIRRTQLQEFMNWSRDRIRNSLLIAPKEAIATIEVVSIHPKNFFSYSN